MRPTMIHQMMNIRVSPYCFAVGPVSIPDKQTKSRSSQYMRLLSGVLEVRHVSLIAGCLSSILYAQNPADLVESDELAALLADPRIGGVITDDVPGAIAARKRAEAALG